VVDSSKVSTYGSLLPQMRGVEPYFVHLVRDPRAMRTHGLRADTARATRAAHHDQDVSGHQHAPLECPQRPVRAAGALLGAAVHEAHL
jgi:hypothetical protein